jgi:hypothetical protein
MLCSGIISVCSEIHIKHKNTFCGQNAACLNVKTGDTRSNYCDLKGQLLEEP